MNRRRTFTLILIFLLLVSAFVAAFHHHENTADDHDCPICVAGNHQQAAGISPAALDGIPFIDETIPVISAPVLTEQVFVSLLNSRAPPA